MRLTMSEFLMLLVFIILVVLIVAVTLVLLNSHKGQSTPSGGTMPQTAGKTMGQALKDHRTRCRLTQEAVAKAMGVSPQLVNQWETGAADPTMTNLNALAQIYGVTIAQLLQGVR